MRISDWSSDVCSSDLVKVIDDLGMGLTAIGTVANSESILRSYRAGTIVARAADDSGEVATSRISAEEEQRIGGLVFQNGTRGLPSRRPGQGAPRLFPCARPRPGGGPHQ